MTLPEPLPELAHEIHSMVSTGASTPWAELDEDVRGWWRRVAYGLAGKFAADGVGFQAFEILNANSGRLMFVHPASDGNGLSLTVFPPGVAPPRLTQRHLSEYLKLRAAVLHWMDYHTPPPEMLRALVGLLALTDDIFGFQTESEESF